jgi:hypothetical protein
MEIRLSKDVWEKFESNEDELKEILNIKQECLDFLEDRFSKHFSDMGSDMLSHSYVERCEMDEPYDGEEGGKQLAEIIIEICEDYCGRGFRHE